MVSKSLNGRCMVVIFLNDDVDQMVGNDNDFFWCFVFYEFDGVFVGQCGSFDVCFVGFGRNVNGIVQFVVDLDY